MRIKRLAPMCYWAAAIHCSIYSKMYSGPGEAFVRSYVHDISLPFLSYFASKFLNYDNFDTKFNAGTLFLFCSAGEAAQGLGWLSGTFDPKDFLAYGAGPGLALALDKITEKRKSTQDLSDLVAD